MDFIIGLGIYISCPFSRTVKVNGFHKQLLGRSWHLNIMSI